MEGSQQDKSRKSQRKQAPRARVVQTPDEKHPYKVVFTDEHGDTSEHPFATVLECEAFIRRHTPAPAKRSTIYDREAGEA